MIDFNDTERNIFKRMENHDQSMALFDMLRYVRAEIASMKRVVLEIQGDLLLHRSQGEEQGTTEKIKAVLNERFDFLKYFMDRVLPNIITVIVLGILYLVFGKP